MIYIGTDPEFMILKNHREIDIWEFMRHLKGKACPNKYPTTGTDLQKDRFEAVNCRDCKNITDFCYKWNSNHENSSPKIGCDGDNAELRPDPSDTPEGLLKNIKNLLVQIPFSDKHQTLAGTIYRGNGLGGHIHFGYPEYMSGTSKKSIPFNRVGLNNVFSCTAGLLLKYIEDTDDIEERCNDGYGIFGCFYDKSYGIEQRMPASFLVNEEIALATLSLSYVVGAEYHDNPKTTKPDNHIIKIAHDDDNEYRRLLQMNPDDIIKKVEKMKYYSTYRKNIEPLFQMIINGEKWDTNENFMDQWSL